MKFSFLLICTLPFIQWPLGSHASAGPKIDSLLTNWNLEKDTAGFERKISQLLNLAQEYRYSLPDSALKYYEIAYELARSRGDRKQQASLSFKKGGVYYTLGDYDFALDYFLEGLSLGQEVEDRQLIAVGLNDVALIYNMQNQEKQAIENHKQSIAICREIGDTLLWARNLHNIGTIYDNLKVYDSALIYADRAIAMLPANSNRHESYGIRIFKGWVWFNKKEYQQAEKAFQWVLSDTTYSNKWEISYALVGLASVYQKLGHYEQSIRFGLQSLKLAREVNALWDLQLITRVLAESYAGLENFKEAYHSQVLLKTYSDSLFNEAKEKEINYLQLRHQEDENLRLAQENELNEQRIEQKNFQLIGYSAGLFLLVVLAFVLYQKVVQKNRLNRELQKKNTEIAEKNNELVHLNATKDTLFHIMAHDMKSPMSIMISFTELLHDEFETFSRPEILKIIDKLNHSSREGLHLLENLLDWAKSQTGKLSFAPRTLQVATLVSETIQLMSGNAGAKQIEISTSIPSGITCFADPNMTSVILRNLISNAIKFTPVHGKIDIYVTQDNEAVNISISDNGVGIPPEDQEKLFHIDTLFTTMGTNHEKGSGIGLILCRDFVTKQGGTLSVESVAGQGSRFWFTLPKEKGEERT